MDCYIHTEPFKSETVSYQFELAAHTEAEGSNRQIAHKETGFAVGKLSEKVSRYSWLFADEVSFRLFSDSCLTS